MAGRVDKLSITVAVIIVLVVLLLVIVIKNNNKITFYLRALVFLGLLLLFALFIKSFV